MATKKRAGKPKQKRREPAPRKEADTCFTIMPFGGWLDTYYETIYVPAIEAAGLVPCRADDLYRPSTIVHDIWNYTQTAKLVLADLSGKNPNVFYELGLAHALAKPAILVTESIDDVPFDLRALRVLEYNKNQPDWGVTLREKVTSAIKEVVEAPLQSVLPAFLSVRPDAKTKSVSEGEKTFLELKKEIDLLRNEVGRSRLPSRRLLDPDEARDRIRTYVERGLPDDFIVRRVSEMGPPSGWVRRTIDELKAKKEPGTSDSSKD